MSSINLKNLSRNINIKMSIHSKTFKEEEAEEVEVEAIIKIIGAETILVSDSNITMHEPVYALIHKT